MPYLDIISDSQLLVKHFFCFWAIIFASGADVFAYAANSQSHSSR